MKRKLRLIAATLLCSVVGYYVWTVLNARRDTPEIMEALRSGGELKLSLHDVRPDRLNALLKVEDPNFYHHSGIDLSTPGAGITTITQALVKDLYFDRFKPGVAKLRQSLIAVFALNARVSKDEQLLVFINTVHLGNCRGKEVRGFPDAARTYYGKDFQALSDDEYLSLVAMIIAPGSFNLKSYPDRNADRVAAIKRLLSNSYKPKGLMDLYYGGQTFRPAHGKVQGLYNRMVWGY